MARRFLKRFEQRIKRVFRQHVNFVDDVDFIACRYRSIAHRLNNLADIINAGMTCGIHFDHVDMPPLGNRDARLTHAARRYGWPTLPVWADTIQRLCDQSRG